MPYTDAQTRPFFNENPNDAKQPGDITYVLYRPVYRLWKAEPRFKTFHEMVVGQRNPTRIPQAVKDQMLGLFKNGADKDWIFAAYDCAVLELWNRHVSKYEEEKFQTNGDVEC